MVVCTTKSTRNFSVACCSSFLRERGCKKVSIQLASSSNASRHPPVGSYKSAALQVLLIEGYCQLPVQRFSLTTFPFRLMSLGEELAVLDLKLNYLSHALFTHEREHICSGMGSYLRAVWNGGGGARFSRYSLSPLMCRSGYGPVISMAKQNRRK